jgi:hypothetical protein
MTPFAVSSFFAVLDFAVFDFTVLDFTVLDFTVLDFTRAPLTGSLDLRFSVIGESLNFL